MELHEEIARIREDVSFIRATIETRLTSVEEQIKPLTRLYNFLQGIGKVLGIAALIAAIVKVFK